MNKISKFKNHEFSYYNKFNMKRQRTNNIIRIRSKRYKPTKLYDPNDYKGYINKKNISSNKFIRIKYQISKSEIKPEYRFNDIQKLIEYKSNSKLNHNDRSEVYKVLNFYTKSGHICINNCDEP